MEKLIVLLTAIVLVVLGARGTYKPLWNAFFPNEPIVTTPTPMPGILDLNQLASNPAYNPVAAGQAAGTAARQAIQNLLPNGSGSAQAVPNQLATGTTKSTTGKTIITGGGAYPITPIGSTNWTPVNGGNYNQPYNPAANNRPSWWPSWLPWPGA